MSFPSKNKTIFNFKDIKMKIPKGNTLKNSGRCGPRNSVTIIPNSNQIIGYDLTSQNNDLHKICEQGMLFVIII